MRLFEANSPPPPAPSPEIPHRERDKAAHSELDPDTSKKKKKVRPEGWICPFAGQTSQSCQFRFASSSALLSHSAEQRFPVRCGPGRTLCCSAIELVSKEHRAGKSARKIGWRSLPGLLACYTELLQQVLPPQMGGVQGPPVPPPAIPLRILYPPWPQGSAK